MHVPDYLGLFKNPYFMIVRWKLCEAAIWSHSGMLSQGLDTALHTMHYFI